MKNFSLFHVFTCILLVVFLQTIAVGQNNRSETSLIPETPLQEDQLPPQVSSEFQINNPEVKHATWTQNGENYVATFESEGAVVRSEYNYDGTWIGNFHPVDEAEIPAAVKKQLDKNYQGQQIEEAYKVETQEGIHYQFSVSDGEQENYIRFDPDGNQVEIAESMNNEKMEDPEK
jgi:uncharacterized protein YxeA